MSGTNAFKAVLTAEDLASVVVTRVGQRIKELGAQARVASHEIAEIEHVQVWDRLGEHVTGAREHFGELRASIGEAAMSMAEFLPAMGAIASVGSVGGVFEMVEHASEGYAQLAHTAAELGVSSQQLHDWNIAANLSEISAEAFAKSMNKLNITLADAARGHNKDAAKLFAQLHMDPRSFHDSVSALGPLADAFAHTEKATNRASMAATLFGARAGKEMLPLLMKGSAGVEAVMAKVRELGVNLEPYGEGLESYNQSMKELGIVAQDFTYQLGGALAPVLRPVVDEMKDWVVQNRAWLATDLAGGVKTLAEAIKDGDWRGFGGTLRGWADDARAVAGGLSQAAGVLNEVAGVHHRQTKDELRADPWWQRGKSAQDIAYAISMAPDEHDEPTPVRDWLKGHLPAWMQKRPAWIPREPQDGDFIDLPDALPAPAQSASAHADGLRNQLAVNRRSFGTFHGAPPDGYVPVSPHIFPGINVPAASKSVWEGDAGLLGGGQVVQQLVVPPSLSQTLRIEKSGKVDVNVTVNGLSDRDVISSRSAGDVRVNVSRSRSPNTAFHDMYHDDD